MGPSQLCRDSTVLRARFIRGSRCMSCDRGRQSVASATEAVAKHSLAWLLLLVALPVCAQQLSVRRYDVSDGLAHSQVVAIRQDRKGYLWFGTWEGLSRFDGYRFTNYGVRDGLGHPIVNHIIEDRHGRLWFATNGGGVARLLDDPRDEVASSSRRRQRRSSAAILPVSAWVNRLNRIESTTC